jgi:Holliday junction resolvasome RuvABC endonuclease subunit
MTRTKRFRNGNLKVNEAVSEIHIIEPKNGADNTIKVVEEKVKKVENPFVIVSEQPHGSQNARAMLMVGICLAVVESVSILKNIPLEWYMQSETKKHLLGRANASKDAMVEAIKKEYKLEWRDVKYIDEAVADSLAVYHLAKEQCEMIKLLNNG